MNSSATSSELKKPDSRVDDAVDFSKPFIPESLTPLYYTPVYTRLTAGQRLRYNQLHAFYVNEQSIWFERDILSIVLSALLRRPLPGPVKSGLRRILEEERVHTEMFLQINRKCAPRFYARGDYHFIRISNWWNSLLEMTASRPHQFPLFLCLMLLQEERFVHYSKTALQNDGMIEPHFLEMHRNHLSDEIGHVPWGEQLLDHLWTSSGGIRRRVNARLFIWMVGEFFTLPKRGGIEVVKQLAVEFPELSFRLPEMLLQIWDLGRNDAFQITLYSRSMVPRTFSLLDRWPEFRSLGRVLRGYRPNGG